MTKNNLPDNLFYNRDYSWVKIKEDIAIVGVIKPAADKVKEFVFIKLPKKGQVLKQGETYVSLEAVKWSGHLSSPLSGEIKDVNEELFDEPSKINQEPYDNGWIMKIKLSDPAESEKLLKVDEARKWVESGMEKNK